MRDVYDPKQFEYRVAFAASYISRGSPSGLGGTRSFDTCFEMGDADYVAAALFRRIEKDPSSKLAQNIWLYIDREMTQESAVKMMNVRRRDFARLAFAEINRRYPDQLLPALRSDL